MVRAVAGLSAFCLLVVEDLRGGIIRTTGMVQVWQTPPRTVEVHRLERNRVVILFEEQTRVLPVDVSTDIATPGWYETVYPMAPGVVPAGTEVTAYYLHADPRGRPRPPVRYVGSVTFDNEILGILVKPSTMHPTDHLLGLPSVRYPREHDRRQGVLGPGDYVWLSPDRRTVRFDLRAGQWSDDFRVLVAAPESPANCGHGWFDGEALEINPCPEPSTLMLFGTIAGPWAVRRLLKRSRSRQLVALPHAVAEGLFPSGRAAHVLMHLSSRLRSAFR